MADTTTPKAAAAKKPATAKTLAKDPVAQKNVAEKSAAAPKAAAPVSIKTKNPAKAPAAKKAERTSGLKVTQVASAAGRGKTQAATLQGLGLGRIRRSKILPDTPSVRGMIASLKHLVKMEVVG